jgi:hypothetical protein
MMARTSDIQYFVLPDPAHPYLLARVRWPDVFHAISPSRPEWQDDPGLFDLPYDPSSTNVTLDEAAAIAAEWGARLPTHESNTGPPESSLIRRMPADWSNLSPAETRAWSIDLAKHAKRAARVKRKSEKHVVEPSRTRQQRSRWWRRRAVTPSPTRLVADATPRGETHIVDLTVTGTADSIDLTDTGTGNGNGVYATVEDE